MSSLFRALALVLTGASLYELWRLNTPLWRGLALGAAAVVAATTSVLVSFL